MRCRVQKTDVIFGLFVHLAAVLTSLIVVSVVGYILIRGTPHLSLKSFMWEYRNESTSVLPAIINTVKISVASLAIALPTGVFSALYFTEYAKRGSKFALAAKALASTLAGIPSIIYGLFGMLVFVIYFRWGYTLLGGAFTMALMILPIIIQTADEAIRAVPYSYREGSIGLGAGKMRTNLTIVLPAATPGILAGAILATGRIAGEIAALIYTAGTASGITDSMFDSGRTLSVHMYALYSEGLYMDEAAATAVVLLIIVILINGISTAIINKIISGGRDTKR